MMKNLSKAFKLSTKPTASFYRQSSFSFAGKKKSDANVEIIQSVEGNTPPMYDTSIEGRYASSLFTAASQKKALHDVFQDMSTIKEIYDGSEAFRIFVGNESLKTNVQLGSLNKMLKSFKVNQLTQNLLETVVANKRLKYLGKVSSKYLELYRILSKEEKLTIISAAPLDDSEKQDLLEALQGSKITSSTKFEVTYEVNPEILGGLQIYTENEYIDLSAKSRINAVMDQLDKIVD